MLASPHREDRLLLAYSESASRDTAVALNESLGAAVAYYYHDMGNGRMVTLDLRGSSPLRQSLIELIASGLVVYAEPDYIVYADQEPGAGSVEDPAGWAVPAPGEGLTSLALPNDFANYNLYGMSQIAAPAAWDALPDPDPGDPEVVVAVIDTGVRWTHEDLAANMWVNPGEIANNGIDDDGNGYVDDVYGWNAITRSGSASDDHGHGTHCAGTIAAVGANNKGVVGVAWKINVKLMPVRFMMNVGGNSSGSTSDAIAAIQYAVDNGADILSNSWGGGGYSVSLYNAIEYARANDVLFVAAAGNEAINNDSSPHYPSSLNNDNIVAVASSDSADHRSSFSNYGHTSVDVFAPGSSIVSTYYSADNAYVTMSGTSMATPLVAGAAAVLKSAFPAEDYAQLRERLLSSVDRISGLNGVVANDGRINLAQALNADLTIDEDDLVWYHPTQGRIVLWKMDGLTHTASYTLTPRVYNWTLVARADIDHDGNPDLFWHNPSDGRTVVWTMEGTCRRSGTALSINTPGWNLVGVGDFNTDGEVDLLWQNPADRRVAVWYMNGTNRIGGGQLNASVYGWNIVAGRDDGNDGNLDIYWHNPSSGDFSVWHMSGANRADNLRYDNSGGPGWEICEARDADHDGEVDLLWNNVSTGELRRWIMSGSAKASVEVYPIRAPGWHFCPSY